MLPPPAKRLLAKLAALTAVALAPKCLLCGLAYAGLLGVGRAELCGATPADTWPHYIPAILGMLAAAGFVVHQTIRRPVAVRT